MISYQSVGWNIYSFSAEFYRQQRQNKNRHSACCWCQSQKQLLIDLFFVSFLPDKPSQPGEIDTVNVDKSFITIRWQAPECDGGKEVLGYWVEYRKSIESTWKKSNKQRLKEMEFTMPGLAEATEYEFRVFAENETGMSRPRRTATCIRTKLSGE